MTEEDKIEKKEKAIIRRRWNQIKKFKKDSVGEPFSKLEEQDRDLPNSCKTSRSMPLSQQISSPNSASYSQHKSNSVQHSDFALKERRDFPNTFISGNLDSSILPSAAATARAVVSEAEYEHQLSQLPKLEYDQPSDREEKQLQRAWGWDPPNLSSPTSKSSNVTSSFEDRRMDS